MNIKIGEWIGVTVFDGFRLLTVTDGFEVAQHVHVKRDEAAILWPLLKEFAETGTVQQPREDK